MAALITRTLVLSALLAAAMSGVCAGGPVVKSPRPHFTPGLLSIPPPQFAHAETMTPPFGLQVGDLANVVDTTAFNPQGPILAHNPSVIFNFPITPDIDRYLNGGMQYSTGTIGWKGHIYTEACLTKVEAQAWPWSAQENSDPTTCPDEQNATVPQDVPRVWYQVADATADLYVVQNHGFIDIPAPVAVSLRQITMPLRFHLNGYIYFYSGGHTGPNDMNAVCRTVAYTCLTQTDIDTPAFDLVVLPTALIQLKIVPETIVYLPPGDASSGQLTVTRTFSTTLAAGDITEIDNSTEQDKWMELVDGGGFEGDIDKVLSLGFNADDDTKWDKKTTLKTGQALDREIQVQNQSATAFSRMISANPATIPGANGPFANEPFWGDQIVVLVHPQLAVWNFFGGAIVQQMAASSAAGLPEDLGITVGELDACANGAAPYANGYTFTTASEQQEVLSADECRSLAALDPFWGKGQSADLTGRGQLMVPSQEYGIPPVGPPTNNSLGISNATSNALTLSDQNTVTYASTVEDIVATTSSDGMKFGLVDGAFSPFSFGLTDTVTLKPGSSTDTSLTMNLTYKNSSATTYSTDIDTQGQIDDDTNRGYSPHVEIYRDDSFGTLMFRDPDAQCSPMPDCRSGAPLGPSNQVPHHKLPSIVGPAVSGEHPEIHP
jgi:hypothetical protein